MSSTVAEKERRRQERLERERQLAAGERRARTRRHALSAVAVVGLVAAVIALAALGGGGSGSSAQAAGPFGTHYPGLDARRTAALVPTMMDTMNSPVHVHAHLSVQVDGKPLAVPANVGVDPSRDSMQMAGLHTHDATGTIHVEGMAGATLGPFFAVWGVPFTPTRFGPYQSANVRVLVNGKPSRSYGALKLADGQQIEVVVSGGRKLG